MSRRSAARSAVHYMVRVPRQVRGSFLMARRVGGFCAEGEVWLNVDRPAKDVARTAFHEIAHAGGCNEEEAAAFAADWEATAHSLAS